MTTETTVPAAVFIAELRSWKGTPWIESGAVKGVGCNCLGLIASALGNVGLTRYPEALAPFKGMALPPDPTKLLRGLKTHLTRKALRDAAPGDLLLFRSAGLLIHVSVLTEPGVVIQALRGKGVVEHKLVERAHSVFGIPGIV